MEMENGEERIWGFWWGSSVCPPFWGCFIVSSLGVHELCHTPNPKESKAWERHLKSTSRFPPPPPFDNSIQINYMKYQHQELS